MRIPGEIHRRLIDAFLDAFDRSSLTMMVNGRLDEKLEELIEGGNLRVQVHELLTWAQRVERLAELADAACAEVPGNRTLQTACEALRDHLREADVESSSSSASASERLPFWNVPHRNEYFTGREDLLGELEARLGASRSAALTQAISGLGGVGKTQTAIEYCHRHRSDYEAGVYWADASSAGALEAEYASLAVARGLAESDTAVDVAAATFLRELTRRSGWLVVLDNADEIEAVRDLMPPTTGGHVLVTTRVQNPDLGRAQPLAIDVLPEEQATDFLLERARREESERATARDLAEALGYLPLALEQAGAYLARHKIEISAYLGSFEKRRLDLVERQGPGQGHYEATVATTWEISFLGVEEASPAAVEALNACGFLAPDEIPLELFTETEDRLGSALGALAEDVAEDQLAAHERLIEPLTRYSLARFARDDGGRFSVHRLVQEVILRRLEDQDLVSEVSQRVHRALDHCFPPDPASPDSWPAGSRWLPHVKASLAVWLKLSAEPDWDPTRLWLRAGHYAWSAGRSSEALTLEESALSVRRRVLGEEHPDTLTSMNNLAETLRALGDASGARNLLESALSVARRVLGEEHPDTLKSMNNLALALVALGDVSGARDLQEAELAACRRVLGEEHPDTLISMHNLCVVQADSDELELDEQLVEQLLSGVRKLPEGMPFRVAAEKRWLNEQKG